MVRCRWLRSFLLLVLATIIALIGTLAIDQWSLPEPPTAGTYRLAPGDEAPAFALQDVEGKEVRLSDFKGMPVVLEFGSLT